MRIEIFIACFVALLPLSEVLAQRKLCDEFRQVADTFICEDFIGKSIAPAREHYFVNGKMIFTRRWYYQDNGEYYWLQFKSRSSWAKRNGPAQFFYADGTTRGTTTYKQGRIIGPCRSYYTNGVLGHTCERHTNGGLDGMVMSFHENGRIKFKAEWKNGRLQKILRYKDEQGNDLPIGTFQDGNGQWIQYKDGLPFGIFVYRKGKLVQIMEDVNSSTPKR